MPEDKDVVLPPLTQDLRLEDAIEILRSRTAGKWTAFHNIQPFGDSDTSSGYKPSEPNLTGVVEAGLAGPPDGEAELETATQGSWPTRSSRSRSKPDLSKTSSKFVIRKTLSEDTLASLPQKEVKVPRKKDGLKSNTTSVASLPRIASTGSQGRAPSSHGKAPRAPPSIATKDVPEEYRPSSKGQDVSKEAALAFWGMNKDDLLPKEQKVHVVDNKAEKQRMDNAFFIRKLADETSVPMLDLQEAVALFRRYSDNDDNLLKATLRMSEFGGILAQLCNVHDVRELQDEFVQSCFKSADRDSGGTIDVAEFVTWYSAFSFSESMVLSSGAQDTRALAREHNLTVFDIERYKKAFDKFDTDGSGNIELEEFGAILNELLKVPKGEIIPEERVQSLWRSADTDGSGEIDFPEFIKFYLSYFDDRDDVEFDPFADYYKSFRRV